MLKGKDIVVTGLQPWDIKIGSNCKNIALELSRHNRVLYVNAPMDRKTMASDRREEYIRQRVARRKSGESLVQLGPGLWNLFPDCVLESIGWLPGGGVFDLLNRVNNRRFAKEILRATGSLGFGNFLLFTDSDMFRSFYLPELLKPVLSVYYSRDNLMAVPYFYKHGHVLEPKLMAKSTLVCANSVYLADLARRYNRHAYYVGQGCDLSLFDPGQERVMPADLAALPRPIVGYIGAIISNRLDLGLLEELCKRKPEWSFVFVGKADDRFGQSPLTGMPNVHFMGLRKEDELADYLAGFDVAINPQALNALTVGNYPRKIDEYLAMGKPVVATETPTMRLFGEYVYLGNTAEDYERMIGLALAGPGPEVRRDGIAFARSHTWEASVEAISEAILAVRPDLGGQ